ncbi:MAG: hypothetical protein B6D44_04240 [Ignavibacteriales bacterium UTCHB2]|jgi:hypothetical protein|nr:MAG: hypothetical protein B6D44_04240 [Ignavibacteriales bacterium UTCHB2]
MFKISTILTLFCCSLLLPQTIRKDGNWWTDRDEYGQSMFVIGFFSGMDLGERFSYWKYYDEENNPCDEAAVESYVEYWDNYVANVNSSQVVDGLNEFYKDYRNRKILIKDAVWLILNEISGRPKEEMDVMIENFRKNTK